MCVCVRQSSDTRGVNGNPGSLPLFMVDGSQFSVRGRGGGGGGEEKEEEKRAEEECKNEVEVVRRGSCSEALINISPY